MEHCAAIDAADLRRAGVFHNPAPRVRTLDWTFWGHRSAVAYAFKKTSAARGSLVLSHIPVEGSLDTVPLTYWAEAVVTHPYYGGARWWWLCPLAVGGNPCGQRVRILYRPFGAVAFGCRRCHGLTYASRQEHRGPFEPMSRLLKLEADAAKAYRTRRWSKQKLRLAQRSERVHREVEAWLERDRRRRA